jgi:hypothetical protein
VQFARFIRTSVLLLPLGLLAAGFPSCSNSNASGASDGGDDRSAIDLDSTLPDDGNVCDPCEQVCPCTLGDTFYNTAQCKTEVCGASQMWGGVSCSEGPGCPPCDPCTQMCPCFLGDIFFNPAMCDYEICGMSLMWGGVSCTVGPGCPDAGDGGSDAASNDADVATEAAPGPEASVEAGAD